MTARRIGRLDIAAEVADIVADLESNEQALHHAQVELVSADEESTRLLEETSLRVVVDRVAGHPRASTRATTYTATPAEITSTGRTLVPSPFLCDSQTDSEGSIPFTCSTTEASGVRFPSPAPKPDPGQA
jgi:hypothetical protein